MSPRVHHAVFNVSAWLAGMAGFVGFCALLAGRAGPADPVLLPVPPRIDVTMAGLLFLALRAALAGAFLGLLVKSVGVAIPARCDRCHRWAARRISTRPATSYRCGSCGVTELVASEAGSSAQDALDDIGSERVDQVLHESSPAAGQLSTPPAEGGALSPPAASGKLTLED